MFGQPKHSWAVGPSLKEMAQSIHELRMPSYPETVGEIMIGSTRNKRFRDVGANRDDSVFNPLVNFTSGVSLERLSCKCTEFISHARENQFPFFTESSFVLIEFANE